MSHINAVDGIYHVIRAFPNEEIVHDEGSIDPVRDIEIINGELIAKDQQHIERVKDEYEYKLKRKHEKRDEEEYEIVKKVVDYLGKGTFVKDGEWSPKEVEWLNKHLFLTSKPMIYLVNIGFDEYIKKQNKWLPKIAEHIKNHVNGPMIPFSAEFEACCVDANKEDKEV